MCILESIRDFVKNGAKTLSEAAHGEYRDTSTYVEILTQELNGSSNGPAEDKRRLREDRKRVCSDVATAFDKYIVQQKQ